jgi:hypothetical protein
LAGKAADPGPDAKEKVVKRAAPDLDAFSAVQDGSINRSSYEKYLFNKEEVKLAADIYRFRYFRRLIVISLAVYKKIVSLIFDRHAR